MTRRSGHALRFSTALAALLLLFGLSSSAWAERAAVIVSGKVDKATLGQIENVSSQYLRDQGWTLIEHASAAVDASAVASCVLATKSKCVVDLTAPLGVERVLLVTANREKGNDGTDSVVITAWLLSSADGAVQISDRRYCERCTSGLLDEAVTALMTSLIKDLRTRQGHAVVRVRSTPAGALVSIDGERVGTAGMEFGVSPGPHRVSIELDGYTAMVRDVTALDGAQVDLDVKLEVANGKSSRTESGSTGVVKWVAGGAGIVMVAGGILLLSSGGSSSSGGDLVPTRDNYSVPGIALTAAGVVAIGASGYLFYRDRKTHSAAPTVAFDHGGVWFGVMGSF